MSVVLALAHKDLRRALRSFFLVGMAVGIPLGITGVIALSFGGAAPERFDPVRVVVVEAGARPEVISILEHEAMEPVLAVPRARTLEEARERVIGAEAEVALHWDARAGGAQLQLFHDPAATVRPQIAATVLERVLDVEVGARLIAELQPAEERDAAVAGYLASLQAPGEGAVAPGPALVVTAPTPGEGKPRAMLDRLKARILLAQLIFFAFFAAGYGAQTLLKEEEEGTLTRLRTLPLTTSQLLAGKASFVTLLVALQSTALLVAARVLFDVDPGPLPLVVLAQLGLIGASVGLGVFLVSLVRTSRQVGPLLGGALTVMGMAGGLFTVGFAETPRAFALLRWFVPHGWAMRGFEVALVDGSVGQALATASGCVVFGAVLGAVGLFRFHRRFRVGSGEARSSRRGT